MYSSAVFFFTISNFLVLNCWKPKVTLCLNSNLFVSQLNALLKLMQIYNGCNRYKSTYSICDKSINYQDTKLTINSLHNHSLTNTHLLKSLSIRLTPFTSTMQSLTRSRPSLKTLPFGSMPWINKPMHLQTDDIFIFNLILK